MITNDKGWLQLAQEIALLSPDPSSKVGAVVAKGLAGGYTFVNEPPEVLRRVPNVFTDRAVKYPRIVHAEMWAIMQHMARLMIVGGGTLYCTHPACSNCAKHMVAAGVRRLVTTHDARNLDYRTRWAEDVALTNQILKEANVEVVVL